MLSGAGVLLFFGLAGALQQPALLIPALLLVLVCIRLLFSGLWFRYQITTEGFGVMALVLLIGFAAWHSGTNLLYLMFSTLLAAFLTQAIIVGRNLRGIEVSRVIPGTFYARQPSTVVLKVLNKKRRFSSYALTLTDYTPEAQALGTSFVFRVEAEHGDAECAYQVAFPHRGVVPLAYVGIVSKFPLGLMQRTRVWRLPDEVLVFPSIHDVLLPLRSAMEELGEQESDVKGAGTDLYGLREYGPGDSSRHIHWRSSVKTQRLMVKEFERDERRRLQLFLPNELNCGPAELVAHAEEFEHAVVFAASLASYLIRQDYEMQLVTSDGAIPFGDGVEHLHRVLRVLAGLELRCGEGALAGAGAAYGRAVAGGYGPAVRAELGGALGQEEAGIFIQYAAGQAAPARRRVHAIDCRQWEVAEGKFVARTSDLLEVRA